MATACGQGNGSANGNGTGGNLAFTKFLFLIAHADDDAHGLRLRTAGGNLARSFFNDFDIDDARDMQAPRFETIQFYVRDGEGPDSESCQRPSLQKARHLVKVSSKYRPRLQEFDEELRRRIGDSVEILALDGSFRNPRYSSPEMVQYSNHGAPARRSGRLSRNAIILPIRKTAEWWRMSTLERHSYFYPHVDREGAAPVKGHALAAEKGITSLFRRVYHNPDGYERPGEFDFVSYFECDDESLPVFDQVLDSLRDPHQNPEWRYVEEGPLWRGRRVLRW